MDARSALISALCALGDDRLILGHRLSEWCGHAPVLEEDIALANIALDLIGQSVYFLREAAKAEGAGRSEDALAFLREPAEFRNVTLVEQPNGDFARTIVRQFLFDAYSVPLLEVLSKSKQPEIAAIAAKSLKEDLYHLRHSRDWMLRLGDGTEESSRRMEKAVSELWPLTGELLAVPGFFSVLVSSGEIPDIASVKSRWNAEVQSTLAAAKLKIPGEVPEAIAGREGCHSPDLAALLAEMQSLQRKYPGAQW